MKKNTDLLSSLKKVLLCVGLFLLATVSVANVQGGDNEIPLQVGIIDPTVSNDPLPKGPIVIPSISLEGHSLYFATPCDGCTLRLLDEDGYVVYTTVIPNGSTNLVLPSYLSGEYEIQIIQGNLYFYGYIIL